ncbi:MAG: polysaccharide deacetylase family protein [Bacteroidota bacterium]|nr:polysaccharide deacetylase family protein [Bacteroidota bacterium]
MNSGSIKRLLSPYTGFIPVEKLIASSGHRFVLPFWHAVSDVPLPHLSQLYRVPTVSEFERNLVFLLKNYKPASVDDVFRLADTNGKSEQNLFFPSFDDGLAECYHVIAPLLKRKGIQAAFFINPAFVGNKMLFHRLKSSLLLNSITQIKPSGIKSAEQLLQQKFPNKSIVQFLRQAAFTDHLLLDQLAEIFGLDFELFLKQKQPYMNLQQIKELQKDGFLIGAHGMDHREFFLSSEDEIMEQISASMEFLIWEINPPVNAFAFPFTDFKVSNSIFEKANTDRLWDLSFGTAGIKDETVKNHLQRIPMESGVNNDGKKVIRTEYFWYYLKSVFGKNKVHR